MFYTCHANAVAERCIKRQYFPDTSRVAAPSGSERGMSEVANSSFRPRAAESGAGGFVPAADQACLRHASPGMLPTQNPI